jgi:hypothetical protein
MPMKYVKVYLTQAQISALRALAARRGMSLSGMCALVLLGALSIGPVVVGEAREDGTE